VTIGLKNFIATEALSLSEGRRGSSRREVGASRVHTNPLDERSRVLDDLDAPAMAFFASSTERPKPLNVLTIITTSILVRIDGSADHSSKNCRDWTSEHEAAGPAASVIPRPDFLTGATLTIRVEENLLLSRRLLHSSLHIISVSADFRPAIAASISEAALTLRPPTTWTKDFLTKDRLVECRLCEHLHLSMLPR